MKVRWLGNASVEIFGSKHIFIDPNPVVDPEKKADIVLLTHEHDDHFSSTTYQKFGRGSKLYAPKTTLEKFDLEGKSVEAGDEIENNIKVLESDCWNSEESVSYFHKGVLHSGDSANFPNPNEELKLVFSACFPDNYDDYIENFKLLKPNLVIPFHYDPRSGNEDAKGLKEKLERKRIQSKILNAGEIVDTSKL